MLTPSPNPDPVAPRWPSWLASLAMHAIVAAIVLASLHRAPRGAAEEPGREVGIVLRENETDGDTDQDEAATDSPTDAPPADAAELLAALPDASAASDPAQFLPQPLGVGAEELTGGAVGDAFAEGAATAGADLSGGKARVRVFGVEGAGTKFVYAFDRSISMTTDGRLHAAKLQLIESLEALDPVHQFQIIFFNHRPTSPDLTSGQRRIAFATELNKQTAAEFVDSVSADGGTDRFAALNLALSFGPDVIFFLTDADDAMPAAEMLKLERRNARVGATICTIEFGSGPRRDRDNFLEQLARSTGGQYGYVDTTRLSR